MIPGLFLANGLPSTGQGWSFPLRWITKLFFVEVEIGRPGRGGQNAGGLAPAQLLDSSYHLDAGRFRLILLAGRRDVVEAAPEPIDPDHALGLVALAGKPVGTGFAANAREVNRDIGAGRGNRCRREQDEE